MPKIQAAVEFFNRAGVAAVLHCGDFVAPFALLPFQGLSCKNFHAVFGNNDGEKEGIRALAVKNGWNIGSAPHPVPLFGRNILMFHEPDRMDEHVGQGHNLLLYGHTHKPKAEMREGTLVLNPGEGGGWLSGTATAALLDLGSLAVEFHEIGGRGKKGSSTTDTRG